jgi:hypothetical protein
MVREIFSRNDSVQGESPWQLAGDPAPLLAPFSWVAI